MAKKKEKPNPSETRRAYLSLLARNKQTKVVQPEIADAIIQIVDSLGVRCQRRKIADAGGEYGELIQVPRGFYLIVEK